MLSIFLSHNKFLKIIRFLILLNLPYLKASASSDQKRPFLWNIGNSPSCFIGREEIIDKLRDYFKTTPRGILALTGISGIGKTQIAKAYVHLNYDSYDIIWWFDSRQDFEPQFHQLAIEWNAFFPDPKDHIPLDKLALKALPNFIKNKLRLTNHSWLLVFDDAPNKKSISVFLPEVHFNDFKRKNILITSQDQNGWEENYIIKTFTFEEALKYIKSALASTNATQAKRLVDTTTLHPFYLAKAVDYIHSNNMPVDIYLKTYKERQHSMKTKNKSLSSPIPHKNDEDSLLLAIADLSTQHPKAYQLLEFISFFKEEHMPHFMAEAFLKKNQIQEDLYVLLKTLREYSFLEEAQKKQASLPSYSLHSIISNLLEKNLDVNVKKKYLSQAIECILDVIEKRWDELVKYAAASPDLIAKANFLWDEAAKIDFFSPEVFRLGKVLVENHIFHTRHHVKHEIINEKLENLLAAVGEKSLDKDILYSYYLDRVYVRKIYLLDSATIAMEKRLKEAQGYFAKTKDDEELLP